MQQHTGNPIVDEAENALRAFGQNLDLEAATRLLPMWHYNDRLSAVERVEVLARFVRTPENHENASSEETAETAKHAFTIRKAGDYFLWICTCGANLIQEVGDFDFQQKLIAHSRNREV